MKYISLVVFCLTMPEICAHQIAYAPDHAPETAVEDLASEHGIVERLLLIYDEIHRRLRNDESFNLDDLWQAATIMHEFIENHHEKIEETYIFPVLEEKGVATRMTAELRKQHVVGRSITQKILNLSEQETLHARDERELRKLLKKFVTMYRVHLSREDVDVFPAFRKLLSQEAYLSLETLFDQLERKRMGKHGLRNVLEKIEEIEKRLSIDDISLVTPVM